MKKRVLLIGNTNGLPGVNKDLQKYSDFFQSLSGGAWNLDEISIITNPEKSVLLSKIDAIRKENLDFIIIIYSGHGGYRRETVLEINSNSDTIGESSLLGLAPKQINVFDCCRNLIQEDLRKGHIQIRLNSYDGILRSKIRQFYERQISHAIEQNVRLYACGINQSAMDTSDGGAYSIQLLNEAKNFGNGVDWKSINIVHQQATEVTSSKFPSQTPIAILPRCLSQQCLPFSVNPSSRIL